jgi:N-acetylmuramoyl-L-alanine amidase
MLSLSVPGGLLSTCRSWRTSPAATVGVRRAPACYDGLLSVFRVQTIRAFASLAAASVLAGLMLIARPASQTIAPSYTLIAANGRRALPFRPAGATDVMSLDLLATVFDFRVQDDPQAGGLVVLARGQRVLLTPGQALVSVGGRIVSLSGPVLREGQSVLVPVDFLSRALGPAMSQRMDVRRTSHLIVLGDVRVPQLAPRFERLGPNGRLTLDVNPPTVHRSTRDGNRLAIRFEAEALDLLAMTGSAPEFVTAVRADGSSLTVDLGPAASSVRTDDLDPAHVTVEFSTNAPAAPPPPPPSGRSTSAPLDVPPLADIAAGAGLRIVAIDPGHGGDDNGAHGAGGAVEKDLTLQVARRLKAAIESRIGLRVLLTREGDEAVPIDRRTALANNNKADLLISLHANASLRPSSRGAQVLSLGLDDYKDRARGLPVSLPVPVVGGGMRLIDAMPWDLAQIPHASQSGALSRIIVQHLTEHHVALYARSNDQAPLRVLVGANMPAVLVEMGFLSNAEDERALTSGDVAGAIVEALIASIIDARDGLQVSGGRGR